MLDSKYKSLPDWAEADFEAYKAAKRRGIISDICLMFGWSECVIKKSKFLSFNEARKYIKKLNIKGETEWRNYCKSGQKPKNIPSHPHSVYKKEGWISWGDWFGNNQVSPSKKIFLAYDESVAFVHKISINSWNDWQEYCKSGLKPNYIPSNPNQVYKNSGWVSWQKWFKN